MRCAHHRRSVLPERTAAVLVALYACLCLGPGAASAADPGSIVGEVTASLGSAPDSSSPVAGAVVTATAPSGATAAATTDAAGDYEIDNLPAPRTYTVSFTPPRGYQPTTTPGVDVMPDQSTEANASLVELPSTVTGVVTGRGGQPLAGMVMEAVPIDFPCPSGDVCGP
jgi:Carboxypeptidase regulatory-like domain